MNFIEKFDQSLFNSFNVNLLSEENRSIFPFLLDESEIPKVEEVKSPITKNLFVTKKTIKEKIKHQKLLLEQKRGLTEKEKNEIYFDKKEDLKRRNRESAQKSRDKKKLELKQIIEENKKLKYEIDMINSKISLLCSECRCIFDLKSEDIKDNNICVDCSLIKNNDNIDINETPSTNWTFNNLKIQKPFNFVLICLFTLLCIFGFIFLNISNNNDFENEKKIRSIKEIDENRNKSIKIINNNFSKINDYFFNNNNYIHSNTNTNKPNKSYKNEICEKDFFTSFQCQKKSFIQKINNYNNDYENNIINPEINNNKINDENNNNINLNKNSIYFKLFLQSCSKDENNINQNNEINENTHYIFSSDNNMCQDQDFYFFCQRTEN